MSGKKRIAVTVSKGPYSPGEPLDEQRSVMVVVDSSATNGELAREIERTTNSDGISFSLRISGFELRDEDTVEMIERDDIVVAYPFQSSSAFAPNQSAVTFSGAFSCPTKPGLESKGLVPDSTNDTRLIFRCLDPSMGRAFAKVNAEDQEGDNTVAVFDGEAISGNTTLAALRDAVGRSLNIISDEDLAIEVPCHHVKSSNCSCEVAKTVDRDGLFSTLHCRKTIDGTLCSQETCPWSHVKIRVLLKPNKPPHCVVCEEALGFPCNKCMNALPPGSLPDGVLYCPLVQNAGCEHLHHAHCLQIGSHGGRSGCPSGCPRDEVFQEALDHSFPDPHIVLVWNGSNIDRIALKRPPRDGPNFVLSTAEVVDIVEGFLKSKDFELFGLLMQIRKRNPTTETVHFSRSTLVSVCPSSAHFNSVYGRQELFSSLTVPFPYVDPRPFHIDLHTTSSPITACDCTPVRELFSITTDPIIIYVVRRHVGKAKEEDSSTAHTNAVAYTASPAWQPKCIQTERGIAALLSSLFVLASSVSKLGVEAENKVLAFLNAITGFPPAARALSFLFASAIPEDEAKSALSECLYQCLLDFVPQSAPAKIVNNPSRLMEAVRILLAHVISAATAPGPLEGSSIVKDVPLICSSTFAQLQDPVRWNGNVVERSWAVLHRPGGDLHHRQLSVNIVANELVEIEKDDELRRLIAQTRLRTSIRDLRTLPSIPAPPSSCDKALDVVGGDFLEAIQFANSKTGLVTRGPLDLKSNSVVAPQIVVDEDGMLAVFTGRGCDAAKDVMFLRPAQGKQVEVNVNDVSFALEKVIAARRSPRENTWQVDAFDGALGNIERTPDEVVAICLDLSASMDSRSGVSGSSTAASSGNDDEQPISPAQQAIDASRDFVKRMTPADIMKRAKGYLSKQDHACHLVWKKVLGEPDSYGLDASVVIEQVGTLARRCILQLGTPTNRGRALSLELACVGVAALDQEPELSAYLQTFLEELANVTTTGAGPYTTPLNLLDPKSGDLLLAPVRPRNALKNIFVNRNSLSWWVDGSWPPGLEDSPFSSAEQLKEEVDQWVSGGSLLPPNGYVKLTLTLTHNDKTITWSLKPTTTTRVLYALCYRFTEAAYSSFAIRRIGGKYIHNYVQDSVTTTLASTDLSTGGAIELTRCSPHSRGCRVVTVQDRDSLWMQSQKTVLLLPLTASVLTILTATTAPEFESMSEIRLWRDMKDWGDGVRRGFPLSIIAELTTDPSNLHVELESGDWYHIPSPEERTRVSSKHLTRLQVLRELLQVLLNRAGSFDSTTSLELALITFSDTAEVTQPLTATFGNLAHQLEHVVAKGDTAVYDALNTARDLLTNYRRDLPTLRRRIIIISDGEDTKSTLQALDVCRSLQRERIVVDSVQIGERVDRVLHGISVATAGYRFAPHSSLSDALSIFDLETMLSSAERVLRNPMPYVTSWTLQLYGDRSMYPSDEVKIDQFPARAQHAKLGGSLRPVGALDTPDTVTNGRDPRTKRLMRELIGLRNNKHPLIDVYVNEEDMCFLKFVFEAPPDPDGRSPYVGGTFVGTCELGPTWPRTAPEVRLQTFILHPNISKQGKVCVAELGRLWTSDLTLNQVFSRVLELLILPDDKNPLEVQLSLKFYEDDGTYSLAVSEAVKKHASKTRAEWKDELEGLI